MATEADALWQNLPKDPQASLQATEASPLYARYKTSVDTAPAASTMYVKTCVGLHDVEDVSLTENVHSGVQSVGLRRYLIEEEESAGAGHGGGARDEGNDGGEEGVPRADAIGVHQIPAT